MKHSGDASLDVVRDTRRISIEESRSKSSEEIVGRFIGVDETDRAIPKIHILKTRSSSEQNLILKTSSLRKGNYFSLSILNQKSDCDKLNNNSTPKECANQNAKDEKKKEEAEVCDNYKKNSNVYSVFQGKTVLKERRRSLPTLPKLIGQKLHEHNQKALAKSGDGGDVVAALTKDLRDKTFRTLSKGIGRLLKRHSSVNISEPDPVFKVAYLGNVLTGWAKGEGCVDKPLSTLWRNYNQSTKPDVVMKLSITNSGLKGITKEHGLTEYWAHRITFCTSPPEFPKIFCWVYRHEGRKLKHELRCHAVLCSKESVSKRMTTELKNRIHQALVEFKKDKIARQNARLSLANCVYDNPSLPRRKILLSVGGNNYKPPLERSKSAPKLMAIEELCSEEDEEEMLANEEKNKNTWTKENTESKLRFRSEDIFPSYTLGRRKEDRMISLPESLVNNEESKDEVDTNSSESSDLVVNIVQNEEDNDVFYCETDKKDEIKVDDRCQTNFIVLDSDEGSISSGCETASTVTSSDMEMSSLSCMQNQEETEKISVLERVQSYEQLFMREREDSLRSSRSSAKSKMCDKAYETSSSPSDSSCFSSSCETGPPSCGDEVNLVPLGENYVNYRTYLRLSTYPPDSNNVDESSSQEGNQEDQTGGDSDSACSVESGYSELSDTVQKCMQTPKFSILANSEGISHVY